MRPLNLHFHKKGWEAINQNWSTWWHRVKSVIRAAVERWGEQLSMGAAQILRELGGKGLLWAINEALTPQQGQALLEELRLLDRIAS